MHWCVVNPRTTPLSDSVVNLLLNPATAEEPTIDLAQTLSPEGNQKAKVSPGSQKYTAELCYCSQRQFYYDVL